MKNQQDGFIIRKSTNLEYLINIKSAISVNIYICENFAA
jgi:hypothetical protein